MTAAARFPDDEPRDPAVRGIAALFPAPALLDAGDDAGLSLADVRVLVWCYKRATQLRHEAPGWEGRLRVKAVAVGFALRMRPQTVSAALDTLVARGYLAAEGKDGTVRTFRLIPEREER